MPVDLPQCAQTRRHRELPVSFAVVVRAVHRASHAVEAEIAPYLTAAPGAVAASKALLFRLARPIDDATIEMTATALADQWETEEAAQGIAAFFAREPAPWANS